MLALDGPARLGDHDDGEPDSLYVARCLRDDGVADWHPLAPVGLDELERFTGAATPDVLRALLDVTGGRAAWAAQLWRHWRTSDVVVQDDDRDPCWRFARDGRARAADPVEDVLGRRRMIALVGDDTHALREARELLVCAALEGRRFTAEGVAAALHRDRDEVIDLLDEQLARDEDHPLGLVVEDGSVEVDDETGRRTLWRYRFAAELDWLDPVAPPRPHGHAPVRARGRVGARASRSVRRRGAPDRARPRPAVHARGRPRLSRCSASSATAAAKPSPATRSPGSMSRRATTSRLASSSPACSRCSASSATAAAKPSPATRSPGSMSPQGNDLEARVELTRVLALFRELGDRRGEAVTRHALARVDVAQGNDLEARAELTRVVARYRELGDRESEAVTLEDLAALDGDDA